MSEEELKVGDVVELRSGGPAMTIIKATATSVQAVWFDRGDYEEVTLPQAALQKHVPSEVKAR